MQKDNLEKIESEPNKLGHDKKVLLYFFALAVIIITIIIFYKDQSYAPEANVDKSECYSNSELDTKEISDGENSIAAEVVSSDNDKAKGLSGRDCISDSRGMLFLYDDSSSERCFWMKDMNFSIDMIWLNENDEVVTIYDNVSPDTYPKSFCPSENATNVLEVNAGNTKRLGWTIGTKLHF